MKKLFKVLLLSSMLMLPLPLVANAADKPAAEKATQTEQVAPDVAKFDAQMAEIQKNLQKMQEQMDKINQTQDPQERQRLLKDHWTTMKTQCR